MTIEQLKAYLDKEIELSKETAEKHIDESNKQWEDVGLAYTAGLYQGSHFIFRHIRSLL